METGQASQKTPVAPPPSDGAQLSKEALQTLNTLLPMLPAMFTGWMQSQQQNRPTDKPMVQVVERRRGCGILSYARKCFKMTWRVAQGEDSFWMDMLKILVIVVLGVAIRQAFKYVVLSKDSFSPHFVAYAEDSVKIIADWEPLFNTVLSVAAVVYLLKHGTRWMSSIAGWVLIGGAIVMFIIVVLHPNEEMLIAVFGERVVGIGKMLTFLLRVPVELFNVMIDIVYKYCPWIVDGVMIVMENIVFGIQKTLDMFYQSPPINSAAPVVAA